MVRCIPRLPFPQPMTRHLVISALTDQGLRSAGCGVAVNHDADGHVSPAPELMQFHLKTREAPLFAAVDAPENSRIICSCSLGFKFVPWRNGSARKMHEHTPPRGDMIAVGQR